MDCLTARTACLVCFISTVNGHSNKKRKEEGYPWKAGTSSGHITNLKQSILETFDINGPFHSGSLTLSMKSFNFGRTHKFYSINETCF
jgi:hypothetical protein